MTYWVFTTLDAANAAQVSCTDALPDDTLRSGAVAPVQITDKWADVIATTDGRFGFVACQRVTMPSAATAMDDTDFVALLPPLPVSTLP